VRACVYRGECSYVYEYLCLYCVSKKTDIEDYCHKLTMVSET
jgi:hypothetical protein